MNSQSLQQVENWL